jgi:three-Cys-motif partner protein
MRNTYFGQKTDKMAKPKSSQIVMLEHSKAKVELFKRYFSIYLNIINRTPFVTKIYLYDLFAGEGKYSDGGKGSPVVAMECIKDHYFSNNQTCPDIDVWFNDFSKSQIEEDKFKIDRVKEFVSNIYKPSNVNVEFTKFNSGEILSEIDKRLAKLKKDERALLFIDPWGYKDIKPEEIKAILINGKTEIILFLPISFMYRFADKAITDQSFSGGKPLEEFLTKLFGNKLPDTNNQIRFINAVKEKFKRFTGIKYIDTFMIERDNNNFFCLFFFTSNKTGYYKMLDSKWKFDEQSGRGFEVKNNPLQTSMFDAITEVDYGSQVEDFLKRKKATTNQELFDFGLEKGFLPKHTKNVLDNLKKSDKITLESLDYKPALGYYIDDKSERKIQVKIK